MSENLVGQALREYRERSGLGVSELAARAQIDRTYLHQLEGQRADWLNRPLQGGRVKRPSRDLVIRLIIGMRLMLAEADELLMLAGYAPLSNKACTYDVLEHDAYNVG